MSALGLIIGNLAVGGAPTGARSGRDPAPDDNATQNFDATLAKSARDATQQSANPSATEAGKNAADGAASSTADAATPSPSGDAQNLLQDLLDLAGASRPASPQDGAVSAQRALAAGDAKAASDASGDGLVRRLLKLSAAAKLPPAAINSATTGAGIACAARHAALGKYASQEIPAARMIPRSSQAAGAAPEGKDDGAAKVADQTPQGLAHAPPPPVPDATLAAAITQSASGLGLATTPANGSPIVAKGDAGTARRGRGAATSAAATADGQARAIETEAAPTPVRVVDLKSWLPPAAPEGASPSAERARTSTANAQNAPTGAALAAKDAAPSAPPASSAPWAPSSVQAQATPTPASPSALQLQPSSVGPAPARQAAPPAPATPAPAANVSAPRRDLEITLEPKDLGGLAVRMKSAGDRLEIAFVADRGDTARLIDDKSAGLASQLRGAGLGLGGLDISVAAKSSDNLSAGLATTGDPSFAAPQNGEGGRQGAAQPRSGAMGQSQEDFTDEASERANHSGGAAGDGGLYL